MLGENECVYYKGQSKRSTPGGELVNPSEIFVTNQELSCINTNSLAEVYSKICTILRLQILKSKREFSVARFYSRTSIYDIRLTSILILVVSW